MSKLASSAVLLCLCVPTLQPAVAQTPSAKPAKQPAAAPLPPPLPKPGTLVDGTAIKMRTGETISSENAKVGQQLPLEVTEDVLVDGKVVLPKGSAAIATVTIAEPKKRMGRGGKLDVNVDSTRLANGQKVQLRAVRESKGGGHVGSMTVGIAATAIVFFPAAPLFLLMHGKDITIPQGTEVTAFVEGDTRIASPAAAAEGYALNAGTLAAPAMASLTVESNLPGADIEVDGAFVGNTPSTIAVTPGQHTITVKKAGHPDWTKTMNVAGSGVRLSADF